jgi:hemerythrin-like domain-containing protein
MRKLDGTRRNLILAAGTGLLTIGTPAIVTGRAARGRRKEEPRSEKSEKKEEVTPPEDLMREHGVLDRVLLLYEAAIGKYQSKEDFDPDLVMQSAEIIRDFINNYHEKSEETHLFPRFRNAGKMVDLVDTLLRQHNAGRGVTQTILTLVPASRNNADDRKRLVAAMQSFIRMYRPHAAREDTELFPMLRALVSSNEYDAMADEFEKKEHELFGEDGFEKMTARVAELERQMGINDLNQFTPH